MKEKVSSDNPFAHPARFSSRSGFVLTASADDRIRLVRESNSMEWLTKVLIWPGIQKTVAEAAARRLRRLARVGPLFLFYILHSAFSL